MTAREKGKGLLANFSKQVKETLSPEGDLILHQRGIKALVELIEDLSGDDAPPGLRLLRDGALKLKLARVEKPGQITVEWQRAIGAIVVTWERMGKHSDPERFLFNETADAWMEMEKSDELYETITRLLAEVLYPDARPRT